MVAPRLVPVDDITSPFSDSAPPGPFGVDVTTGRPTSTSESGRRRLPDHDERRRHRADGTLGLRAPRADEVPIRRRGDVLPAHGAAASVTASSGAALARRAWGRSDPEPQRIHHAAV